MTQEIATVKRLLDAALLREVAHAKQAAQTGAAAGEKKKLEADNRLLKLQVRNLLNDAKSTKAKSQAAHPRYSRTSRAASQTAENNPHNHLFILAVQPIDKQGD